MRTSLGGTSMATESGFEGAMVRALSPDFFMPGCAIRFANAR